MNKSRAFFWLVVAVGLSWTCSDSTGPPRPTRVSLSETEITLDALGATQQLTAQVLDQNDQPLPDEEVTWSSGDESVATVSATGLVTAVGNGTAQVTAAAGSVSGTATATVTQRVAELRKVAGDAQSGTVGAALSSALTVEALDRLENAVTGAQVDFTVVLGSGAVDPASATTGADGRASTTWTLGTTSGGDHQVDATNSDAAAPASFTATALAAAPSSAAKLQGDGQMGAAATPLPDSIVVRVLDEFDNPVPGQTVSFTVTSGGGSASPASAETDAAGRVASEWTLGAGLGENTLEAAAPGLPPLEFTATSMLGPPTEIIKQAGDGQSATVNTAVATPPQVKVTDAGGNPVEGVAVDFQVTGGGGSVAGASQITDAAGLAAPDSWTLGTAAGTNTLAATVSGLDPVSFTATGTPGPPASLAKESGDNQTGTAGLPLPEDPTVKVADEFGNPISGVEVSFAVTSGGGSLTGANPTTTADGTAAVGSWTLGPDPGANELTASVGGLSPVTFTATAQAGAANITKQAGDGQSATVNTQVATPPTVRLTDAVGDPVAGQEVSFAVTAGGGSITGAVATSDADGLVSVGSWTLGTQAGTNELTATTAGLDPVTFTATGTAAAPAQLLQVDGDGQTGLVGFAVNIPPTVQVLDVFDNPVVGETVSFTVTSGAGSVSDPTPVTDDAGVASVAWTLARDPGTNTLDATVSSLGTVTFSASGVTGSYNIEVRFLSSVSSSQQQIFLTSADRWEGLLYEDEPDVPVSIGAGACGANSPALDETIDDLIIFATVEPIDGPGGVLGQAGPCFIRGAPNNLPLLGRMRFDEDDLDNLEAGGQLDEVILHEMAHVLGLGTVWRTFGLLANPSREGFSDPHFTGPRAIEAFDRIGGASYSGPKVPVENSGGAGTADAHWEETVFVNELMTGFLNGGANPLSEVTVASFWDLDYTVNLDGADDFSLPTAALRAQAGPVTVRLVDDVIRGPIYVVDAAGRITRVIPER